MDRRRFLLSAAAFALPIPAGNSLGFKVFRNGSPIGEHQLSFTQNGDDLRVDVNIDLVVTIATIPVFRYGLKATERWSKGVFQSLDSNVNYNGDPLIVHAQKSADGYEVEGINKNDQSKNMPRYTAPPDTLPLTYWNKKMLNSTILNVQTAHCYKVDVASPGWNNVPTTAGTTILAQRFDLTGKLVLSVWYDQQDNWSSLEFHEKGNITYQKIV
jgi:hypothetical protein